MYQVFPLRALCMTNASENNGMILILLHSVKQKKHKVLITPQKGVCSWVTTELQNYNVGLKWGS